MAVVLKSSNDAGFVVGLGTPFLFYQSGMPRSLDPLRCCLGVCALGAQQCSEEVH